MKLAKATILAAEYDHLWANGCRPPDGCTTVAAIDRRKRIRAEVGEHCYRHFALVVDVLERVRQSMVNPRREHPSLGEIQALVDSVQDVEGI